MLEQPSITPRSTLDLDGRNSIIKGGDAGASKAATIRQGTWGIATGVLGHPPSDQDYAALRGPGPIDGLRVLDSSTGTLWARIGSVWQPLATTTGATPTVAAGTALGTSPSAPTLASGSSDRRGQVLFGTGTTPPAEDGIASTVTFSAPMTSPPLVVLTWGSTAAAPPTLAALLIGSAGIWTGFSVSVLAILGASEPAGTYMVNYAVLG